MILHTKTVRRSGLKMADPIIVYNIGILNCKYKAIGQNLKKQIITINLLRNF